MKSLLSTLGEKQEFQKNSCKNIELTTIPNQRDDSLLDSVDVGFGKNNILVKKCNKPKFNTPLFKEDYLSVFKSETEKALIRHNLGVIGAPEVTKLVKDLVSEDIKSFITIEAVETLIKDLDFVDSQLKSNVDYTIPDKLFKL